MLKDLELTSHYLTVDVDLLTKNDYLALLQAPDIKTSVSKIIHKKIGEYIYGFLEQKKFVTLSELINFIDRFYVNKLYNLTLTNNKYTLIVEEILDLYNLYNLLQCLVKVKKPCVLIPNSGVYKEWIMNGNDALSKYLERKILCLLYRGHKDRSVVDVNDFFFYSKNTWIKIILKTSFPVRKALGLIYDFFVIRLLIGADNVETQSFVTAFLSKEEIRSVIKGIKEDKIELLQVFDKYIPYFNNIFLDLMKVSPRALAFEASLALTFDYLTKNMVNDDDEYNLKRYLLLLRESILLRLVFLGLMSQIDKSFLMNLITRRLEQ